ncbi:hypothetical protein BJ878DRAFT_507325 [Calycina marina]|uniref:Uncharacterized protein n=1 Tax=Calycina marina TaxID=1763456 RepID=A0A9P8CEK1_9HELO|nr:hypothetical protein BJ878DRAFT_507325 [Calycina marina]
MVWNVGQTGPLSADCTPRKNSSSMLFSVLSSAVQSRLPRIPSMTQHEQSASMDGGWYSYGRRKPSVSAPESGSHTTIAEVDDAMVLSGARLEASLYFTDNGSGSESSTPHRTSRKVVEDASGIGWKFANQGLNLLSLAAEESKSSLSDPKSESGSFARQLYVHSLTYLLRGLPTDLSPDEQSSLRSAMPAKLIDPSQSQTQSAAAVSPYTNSNPSILHRILALSIVQLYILVQIILPYIQFILHAAYTYDRKHKISEKVLSKGVETANVVGKRGIGLASIVFGVAEGEVGQKMAEAASWFIRGVYGGVHDGIGEGLLMFEATKLTLNAEGT